nr:putative cyclin-d7-1 [Quercus suber]
MANIEDLWARFSLTEEEEIGADVPRKTEYGEWLRADPVRQSRKTVVVVAGTSRGEKSWKKGPAIGKNQSIHKSSSNREGSASKFKGDDGTDREVTEVISMEAESTGVNFPSLANPLSYSSNGNNGNTVNLNSGLEEMRDPFPSHMPMQNFKKNNTVGTDFPQGQHGMFSFNAMQAPLSDMSNQAASQPLNTTKKKWARLLREVGKSDNGSDMEIQENRRPDLESSEQAVRKKKRVSAVGGGNKENSQGREHWMLELLSVACLSIASKFSETCTPSLHEIQMENLDHSFHPSTIQQMELKLLEALGWRLGSTTAYYYVELLMWSTNSLKPHLHEEFITRVTELLLGAISGICIIFIYCVLNRRQMRANAMV